MMATQYQVSQDGGTSGVIEGQDGGLGVCQEWGRQAQYVGRVGEGRYDP